MFPVGYMYKSISLKPDWIKSSKVVDIYSVSSCVSEDFTDWIDYWKHNGHWFFNKPTIIQEIAKTNDISLSEMDLFYYLAYEKQWDVDDEKWNPYEPEESFQTNVIEPKEYNLEGYDIVSFSCQSSPECSPLSCNNMSQEINVNKHCLLSSFEEAKKYVEDGKFNDCEPGPYRIFEVYSVETF
jgi:hypothetical protein